MRRSSRRRRIPNAPRDFRPLSALRPLTTCLLLATMLLSNVAGWMHVGCCDPTTHDSNVSRGSQPAAVSCCGHCHCDLGRQSSEAPTDDSSTPKRESVPHDSESCPVCQNLFASRHAILAAGPTAIWEPLAIGRVHPELHDVSIAPVFLSGLSVRGPPNA